MLMLGSLKRMMGGGDKQEARAPRVPMVDASVSIDRKVYPLQNWSLSGFLLSPYEGDLVPKQRVYLELLFKDGEKEVSFATDAIVVRVDGGGLAARFPPDIRPDARRAIENYFRVRLSRG